VSVDLRVMGLPAEVQATVDALSTCPALRVVAVSRPYPNRGEDARVRVFVAAELSDSCSPKEASR
jgi:hypothetical protein